MKLPKLFKIVDDCTSFHNGEIFSSANEAWSNLADYHEIDWTGEKENGEEIDIYEFLDAYDTDEAKLDFLLEYGQWDIEPVEAIKCPLCDIYIEHEEHNGTHIWPCSECAFIGFEYENNKNSAEVINYLNKQNAKQQN